MAEPSIERRLGERIRQLRLARGMSQPELGDRIGRVFQQVQKYEQGISSPNLSLLCAMADALEVPLSELLAGLADSPPPDGLRPIESEILEAVRSLPSDDVRRALLTVIRAAAREAQSP